MRKRGICLECKNFGSMLSEDCYKKRIRIEILGCQNYDPGKGLAHGSKPKHRELAEKAIGRKLRIDEFVHHLNGNRYDHRPSNLLVCDTETHANLHSLMAGNVPSGWCWIKDQRKIKKSLFAMFRYLKKQRVPSTVLDRFRNSIRHSQFRADFAHEFIHETEVI